METLFTPEVIAQVLEILKTATEGSVTVLVVYFLLPLMMLLVTCITTLVLVGYAIKRLAECVSKYLDRDINEVSKFDLDGKFITINGTPEHMFELVKLLQRKSSTKYIHKEELMDAIKVLKENGYA